MHEFSAACSIVDTAVQAAEENGAIRVSVVNVDVGEFTFLIPEQLEFNFEIASRNTILEGAELAVQRVPGRLKCMGCGHDGPASIDPDLPPQVAMFAPMKCAQCGGSNTVISGGKEFVITSIEAEVESSD